METLLPYIGMDNGQVSRVIVPFFIAIFEITRGKRWVEPLKPSEKRQFVALGGGGAGGGGHSGRPGLRRCFGGGVQ